LSLQAEMAKAIGLDAEVTTLNTLLQQKVYLLQYCCSHWAEVESSWFSLETYYTSSVGGCFPFRNTM